MRLFFEVKTNGADSMIGLVLIGFTYDWIHRSMIGWILDIK